MKKPKLMLESSDPKLSPTKEKQKKEGERERATMRKIKSLLFQR